MVHGQNTTIRQAVLPVSLDDGSATAVEIDCTGYNHVTYVLAVGSTLGAIDPFKVQAADTSGGALTDITGAALTGSDLPGATSDGGLYAIHIDLTDKSIGQFHKVTLTEDGTGAGVYGVIAILSRENGNVGESATARGFAAEAFA